MGMLSVKNDLKNRFAEINTMKNILVKNQSVECQVVLKSALILMLYNTVEGIVSNVLTELFDRIAEIQMSVTDLPERLQKTVFSYLLELIGRKSYRLIDFYLCSNIELCKISYLEISRSMKLYSGNLDSKKIRDISKRMGVDLPNKIDVPELMDVKEIRNKLAHGEIRFSNACQDMTLQELEQLCSKVQKYLNNVICSYERYCNDLRNENDAAER